jgi:hypothetical protein
MQKTFANLFNIVNIVLLVINVENSDVVCLSTRSWVESTLIKENNVFAFVFLLNVFQHSNNFGIELIQSMVLIIQILSFREVNCVIQNGLLGFGNLRSPFVDFVV